MRYAMVTILLLLTLTGLGRAESITIGTWNIENFHTLFEAHRMERTPEPTTRPAKEIVDEERRQNFEDQWEVSLVLLDPKFSPDVLVIQEGCRQGDLEFFNRRWLRNAYATVHVFPTNTDRDQHLGLMMKPGYELVETRTFHEEKDTVPNDRGERLFARGPAFAKVKSPGGYVFWVGTTHQKSKADNSVSVSEWRNRESRRTHEIMKKLAAVGPDDVILLGDINDEPGEQEFEKEAGGSAVEALLGPPEAGFVLATQALAEANEFSFGGYWRDDRRTLIDHVIATPGMKDQIQRVWIYKEPIAQVASDHYPVAVTIEADE